MRIALLYHSSLCREVVKPSLNVISGFRGGELVIVESVLLRLLLT